MVQKTIKKPVPKNEYRHRPWFVFDPETLIRVEPLQLVCYEKIEYIIEEYGYFLNHIRNREIPGFVI